MPHENLWWALWRPNMHQANAELDVAMSTLRGGVRLQFTYHIGSSYSGGHPGGSCGQLVRELRFIQSRGNAWRGSVHVHDPVASGIVITL